MVKSSRPGAVASELNSQVNMLASQFSNSMGIGGSGHKAYESKNESMCNWSSTSSTQAKACPDLESETSMTSAEAESGMRVSHPKYSALGFEVDLTGSQNSDTPFLLPKVADAVSMVHGAKQYRSAVLGVRKEIRLKMTEDRFKKRRAQRLSSGLVVSRLLQTSRQRLLTDLSLMVPGSIERIKRANPSGNGELDWSVLQSWLEGQPDLKAQMNLTTKALNLIATYKGPSIEARSLQALKLYVVVARKMDSDTYGELCSFLFPEDSQFSTEVAR